MRLEVIRLVRIAALALALGVLAGCAGQLATGPQNAGDACDAALVAGTLARSQTTGLGVQAPGGGVVQPVLWPFGFGLRQDVTTVVLVDGSGREVAREGDWIEAGGGADGEGTFVICPADSIRVGKRID
jgi:hypothetical protein